MISKGIDTPMEANNYFVIHFEFTRNWNRI